jgi:hypothetical protein
MCRVDIRNDVRRMMIALYPCCTREKKEKVDSDPNP